MNDIFRSVETLVRVYCDRIYQKNFFKHFFISVEKICFFSQFFYSPVYYKDLVLRFFLNQFWKEEIGLEYLCPRNLWGYTHREICSLYHHWVLNSLESTFTFTRIISGEIPSPIFFIRAPIFAHRPLEIQPAINLIIFFCLLKEFWTLYRF